MRSSDVQHAARRLADWVAAAIVPAMMLELMVPIESSTSVKLAIAYLGLAVIGGFALRLSGTLVAHLVAFTAFLAFGVQPDGWFDDGIVRVDVLNALVALAVAPFVAASLVEPGAVSRFVRRVAALLVVTAAIGAVLGWVKLYFLSQGVFFDALYAADGTYPLGTALGSDYNLYAFGLVAGLAAAFWLRERLDKGFVPSVVFLLTIVLLSSAALLTGSRRGLVFWLAIVGMQLLPRRASAGQALSIGRRYFAAFGLISAAAIGLWTLSANRDRLSFEIAGWQVNLTMLERLLDINERSALVSTRAPLVEFAWQRLDGGGYTPAELLHGRGFSYIGDMGRFFAAADGADYPHNFILSAMLHGGIPFATLLAVLTIVGVATAWRRRDEFGPLTPVLILAVVFALTSSASLYSTEVLVFLLVLIPLVPLFHQSSPARPRT